MAFLITIIMALTFNQNLVVKSTSFANNHYIPFRYTCDGININPGLIIENIPDNAKSLALVMDDIESPNGEFVHWVMWNIPAEAKIAEDSAPGIQGKNSADQNKYFGPCPPNSIHKYHFKVYALDAKLNLADTAGKPAVMKAMQGHILSSGELTGLYKRQ